MKKRLLPPASALITPPAGDATVMSQKKTSEYKARLMFLDLRRRCFLFFLDKKKKQKKSRLRIKRL
ncbi:MAG: hypothetical protein ABIS01_01160, partial [Ferruginibacter sp.]